MLVISVSYNDSDKYNLFEETDYNLVNETRLKFLFPNLTEHSTTECVKHYSRKIKLTMGKHFRCALFLRFSRVG